MNRLLRVELNRLRWRRAAVVLLAAAIVVPLIIAVVTALGQTPPQAGSQARAEQAAQKEIARCVAHPRQYGVDPDGNLKQQCTQFNPTETFVDYNVLDLNREREDGSGPGVVAVIAVLMFLLGTTFVGHDWNTGSMSNQLLFVPCRLRIWVAKVIAVTLAALVASAIGVTAFWLVLIARFESGDSPLPSGTLRACLEQGWRGAGLAAVAVLVGYALTMLSRSTVFTLGLLFGISVVGGLLINIVVDDPGPWDPTINAAAVIKDGSTYYVDVPQSCYADFTGPPPPKCDSERTRSLEQGVRYLAGLIVIIGAGSVLSFRRRDVP